MKVVFVILAALCACALASVPYYGGVGGGYGNGAEASTRYGKVYAAVGQGVYYRGGPVYGQEYGLIYGPGYGNGYGLGYGPGYGSAYASNLGNYGGYRNKGYGYGRKAGYAY